jgi:hypothetical protein
MENKNPNSNWNSWLDDEDGNFPAIYTMDTFD